VLSSLKLTDNDDGGYLFFNDYNMNYPLSATADELNDAFCAGYYAKLFQKPVEFARSDCQVREGEAIQINHDVLYGLIAGGVYTDGGKDGEQLTLAEMWVQVLAGGD